MHAIFNSFQLYIYIYIYSVFYFSSNPITCDYLHDSGLGARISWDTHFSETLSYPISICGQIKWINEISYHYQGKLPVQLESVCNDTLPCFVNVTKTINAYDVASSWNGRLVLLDNILIVAKVIWLMKSVKCTYHDVGEMSYPGQSEVLGFVTWRFRVIQPTNPSLWKRNHITPPWCQGKLLLGDTPKQGTKEKANIHNMLSPRK